MSAREAYIAGRSGGSRPPKQTSPSSTQGNTQQDREQSAYDAGQQERQRAETLANPKKGITSLSQDEREQARSIAEQTGKDPYNAINQILSGGAIKETPAEKFDNFMTSFGQNKINIPFPSIATFGAAALEGMDSTNKFFKNLNTKKSGELSNKDKITLINLVQRGGESGGLQYLKNWAEDNDLSEEETMDLANKFTGEYSNIGSSISDSGIIDYLTEGGKPEGFKDSVAAMFGQYDSGQIPGSVKDPESGEVRDYRIVDGKMENIMVDRPNLETVTDNLGTVGLEYLKATNPAAFYALRPAATSGQIEELARTALTGNKNFDNQIFAAREQAARNKESQDRASGIMTASSAPPAPPPVVPPAEDEVPENPILNPVMSQRDPFNLAQFYASLPQYTRQGVMSPNLASYYDNLRRFYG